MQSVQGPLTTVSGSNAVSVIRMALTHTLGSATVPSGGGEDPSEMSVEDTYSVEFGLPRSGSSRVIGSIFIREGVRLAAIMDSLRIFAEGFVEEGASEILSVCTDPLNWECESPGEEDIFAGVESHVGHSLVATTR